MTDPSDYIFVGKIGRTSGIDGSLTIVSLTSFPERFAEMKRFFLTKERKTPLSLDVENIYERGKKLIVKFKDIDDISSAEKITGYRITVHKDERIKAPQDHYFIEDLIGCNVFDQNNRLLGELIRVMEMSSNDIYVIEHKGKEVLIPAVSEFIKKIDIDSKRIDIKTIDGMIDED